MYHLFNYCYTSSDKHPSVFSDSVCTEQAGDHPPGAVPGFSQ